MNMDEEFLQLTIRKPHYRKVLVFEQPLADGRVIEVRSNPLSDDGLVRSFYEFTELKQAEKALSFSFFYKLPTLHSKYDNTGHCAVLAPDQRFDIMPSITMI